GYQLGTPPIYVTLNTTAAVGQSINVCVSFAGSTVINAARVRLLHAENGSWADVTSSVDQNARVVCGNVSALSGLAVAEFVGAPQTPAITWPPPADIVYGTALGAAQLNATTSVTGTFVYTPSAGTVLGAGSGQTLSVTFTPADAVRYTPSTA